MPRSVRAGFTLIELVIVVSVMAILGAIALPRLRISAYRADAAMTTLQTVLQQAQRSALVRQADVLVSFDTTGARVRVVVDANGNHQYDAGEDVRWHALEDGARFATPPSGVQTAGGAAVAGGAIVARDGYPSVIYHRDGAVSSELELFVRSARPDVTDFRALHVAQATGRVRAYRYDGAAWRGVGV